MFSVFLNYALLKSCVLVRVCERLFFPVLSLPLLDSFISLSHSHLPKVRTPLLRMLLLLSSTCFLFH